MALTVLERSTTQELSERIPQWVPLLAAGENAVVEAVPRSGRAQVRARTRAAPRRGGTLLVEDMAGHTHVEGKRDHPPGSFLYTISCLQCIPVPPASGGPGLEATWGREQALDLFRTAGCENATVETLPHDPINYDHWQDRVVGLDHGLAD